MGVAFPSVDFFEALQKAVADDPTALADLAPCEAYCGIMVGERLFVLEFEGRECAAIAAGGNPLDLDFVLHGSEQAWKDLVSSLAKSGGSEPAGSLAEQIDAGALEIGTEVDEGAELARSALPFLQGFLGLAQGLDIDFG
jgi:hypothetical protein